MRVTGIVVAAMIAACGHTHASTGGGGGAGGAGAKDAQADTLRAAVAAAKTPAQQVIAHEQLGMYLWAKSCAAPDDTGLCLAPVATTTAAAGKKTQCGPPSLHAMRVVPRDPARWKRRSPSCTRPSRRGTAARSSTAPTR